MKNNFLLKKEQREIFESLSDEDAGILIKGIFDYVCDGSNKLEGLIATVFIPIKKEIDKNEEKYQKICERNRQNGSNGGRPRQEEPSETQDNPVGYFGENTHISYITNHISNNHNSYIINQVIDYLNNKLNTKYKSNNKSTIKHINARLNEGYSLDDFIVVIDKMCLEWANDEKMKAYLRPETLFGTKFESYLNRPIKKLTTKNIKISEEEIKEFFK